MPHSGHVGELPKGGAEVPQDLNRALDAPFHGDVFRDRVEVLLRLGRQFEPLHAERLAFPFTRSINPSRTAPPSTPPPRFSCSAARRNFPLSAPTAASRSRSCCSSKRNPSRTTSLAV